MTILAVPDTEGQRPADVTPASDEPGTGTRRWAGPVGAPGATATVERCAWSLVWLGTVLSGLAFWGSWSSWPPGGYLAPLIVVLGIVGTAATWLVRDPRGLVLQVAALVASLAATLGHEGIGIHVRHYYSTDSGAFNQVAAHLLVHGENPYTSSLASASNLLQTPVDYWTYTAAGGHITAVSYPAGSFLMEVPALLLGFHHQITDWVDLLAWLVTGALIFVLLPASLRWIGPLLVAVPLYADVFGSGGTDAVFLPFLVLAVWRWDRFCAGRGAGLARWVGPVALGLACSIKQTPWFCVPFLVVALFLEARASGRPPVRIAAGYLAIVAGVFGAVNLPFIIWQPAAWARGTVLPFDRPLVADGQGLVTLALHGVVRGASLPLLSVVSALVFVSLLAALVVWYPGMKRIWMLLLPLTFFVGARSLLTYLIDLFPAAIVAAASVAAVSRPAHVRSVGRLRTPFALAALVPAAAAVVVAVLAFSAPPLQLEVKSFYSTNAATLLDSVTVDVHNTTAHTVEPHFMVTIGSSHPTGFWHTPDRRPVVLGPHASAVVILRPPVFTGAPTHGSYWLVQAYTSSPAALSSSPLQHWHLGKIK
jgi:uncharacterized membrane protein